MRRTLLAVVVLVATGACASSIRVQDVVQPHPKAQTDIAGIPFRQAESYLLRVYKRTGTGAYEEVHVQREQLPDPDRLFALALSARRFADNELDLSFNPDGTLAVVDFSRIHRADEAINQLGEAAIGVAQQAITYEDQIRAKELERLTQATQLEAAQAGIEAARQQRAEAPVAGREAALEAALAAFTAAEVAAETLVALPDEATEADRAVARGALRLARLEANHAFRVAGLPEPFPGLFP